MITGKEDLLRALIEAYLMEKGTQQFYSDAAMKAVKPGAKKTFSELSNWEERHMEYIQYLYSSFQDDRDIEGFNNFSKHSEAPLTESGMSVKDLEANVEKYVFVDDQGAMNFALEMEGRAYNLYRKLSESASDSNAQVVFREMMEQELGHIDYLRKMKAQFA